MIKTSSFLDHEHLLALNSYVRSSAQYKKVRRILLTAMIACAVVFVLCIVGRSYESEIPVILPALAVTFGVLSLSSFVKVSRRPKPLGDVIKVEHSFDETAFGFVSQRDGMKFERFKRYESLHGAVEWKDWFFIYFTEQEACIFRKDELTEGTVDELRDLLKDKLGNRSHSGN